MFFIVFFFLSFNLIFTCSLIRSGSGGGGCGGSSGEGEGEGGVPAAAELTVDHYGHATKLWCQKLPYFCKTQTFLIKHSHS